jgi:hypothetical protein
VSFNSRSDAAIVNWQLDDVAFADGGQASGFFSVNTVTHTFINWDISVAGGDTSTFPAVVYNPFTSVLNPSALQPYSYSLPLWPGFYLDFAMAETDPTYHRDRQLRLAFDDLPDLGGTIAVDPNNAFAGECYNCAPVRLFTSGGTIVGTAAVPEPSTWAMMLIGFAGLGFAGYRQARRRALAI